MLNYSVYTDMKLVETHLTLPSFHCVPSRKGADILWLGDHFKEFRCVKREGGREGGGGGGGGGERRGGKNLGAVD